MQQVGDGSGKAKAKLREGKDSTEDMNMQRPGRGLERQSDHTTHNGDPTMIGASQVWVLWVYLQYVRKTDLGLAVDSWYQKQKLNRFSS